MRIPPFPPALFCRVIHVSKQNYDYEFCTLTIPMIVTAVQSHHRKPFVWLRVMEPAII